MITYSIGTYLFIAGVISIIIAGSKPGKFWYIFLIVGITFITMRLKMKNITILNNSYSQTEYLTYKNSYQYILKDGNKINTLVKDNTIINDSEFELKIEKVEYGYGSLSSNDNKIVGVISPYSCVNLNYDIDYFYKTPPNSIKVKGSDSRLRFWLHR